MVAEKADEIYRLIPDFGGFLVKANSEGQPGPQDYKRTHADGANVPPMLLHGTAASSCGARSCTTQTSIPIASSACKEFVPLDGKFRRTSSCR